RLTQQVIYFMTPQKSTKDPKRLSPPGLRFLWGSFIFDGLVDSLEESLEFFSPEGKPLRASVSLAMSQQKILQVDLGANTAGPATKGTRPLSPARQGDSLADMAAKAGRADWQSIAQANGIEDPLRLQPGQLVDLAASAAGSVPRG
ncbi:MAG TPA: LysM peptidoglycan-binding domain-containing protein, partial [Usitatibacter sp.]|nr:LysM peptidoglycan-binding domain-containing protein [Usitatibacter sp.]